MFSLHGIIQLLIVALFGQLCRKVPDAVGGEKPAKYLRLGLQSFAKVVPIPSFAGYRSFSVPWVRTKIVRITGLPKVEAAPMNCRLLIHIVMRILLLSDEVTKNYVLFFPASDGTNAHIRKLERKRRDEAGGKSSTEVF